MPGWAKALIIAGVLLVLLIGGVIAGAAFWWSRNKDALIARGTAQYEEGREFGRNSDNQGCVDETVFRYKKEPGFSNVISVGIFIRACLDTSKPTPGFCDDVPKETEFIRSGQWRVEQCSRVNLSSDSYCPQLFTPVQQFCQKPGRVSGEDADARD